LALEEWFDSEKIHPLVVAEISDSALLKVFGQAGAGLFAVPEVVEQDVLRQYGVRVVGRVPSIEERFFGISLERKPKHPAVAAVINTAREKRSR
jgi:LysR family transcriptional activator of nhaA